MKKLITLFLFIGLHAAAQDTIVMKDNSRKIVKVLEIKLNEISYKRFEMPDGPLYVVAKPDVQYIHFASGLKESFESSAYRAPAANPLFSPKEMYNKGMIDASRYYKHPGGSFGVFCASSGCGVLGLIPAIAVSSADPKEQNLGYPDRTLWDNGDYRAGYKYKAKKIKQKKVWMGFGIGLATGIIIVAALRQ